MLVEFDNTDLHRLLNYILLLLALRLGLIKLFQDVVHVSIVAVIRKNLLEVVLVTF